MSQEEMGHHQSVPEYPPSRRVETNYGPIEGRRLIYEGEKQVDAFQGIPYAKPPVGELRFKKPVPPDTWTEVKETKAFGPRSIQKDMVPGAKKLYGPTSEDCLFLNVFTPVWQPSDEKGFAVMVFIHGGAFVSDSCVKYGDINICKNVVTKDVVVVTLQYRLGYLGLWTTGDELCPGNNSFWDMTLALTWVKENIAKFGGDPGNVTLLGQSAGGAAVDLLSLSPRSRDLFHKVIPMAGNASCDWAISYNNVETCRDAAESFGVICCHEEEKYLDELRKLPAEKFALSMMDAAKSAEAAVKLGPRIDGDFLPKHPSELRKEAPCHPRIVGLCRSEGMLFMQGPQTVGNVDKIAANLFPEKEFSNFAELRKEYFSKVVDPAVEEKEAVLREICEANSDMFLSNAVQRCVRDCCESEAPVYMYRFDYYTPKMYGPLLPMMQFLDAVHCNDIAFLFGVGIIAPFEFTETDLKVVNNIGTLFTNFAKYGDPNGTEETSVPGDKWLPVTKDKVQNHLQISTEVKMSDVFFDGRPIWVVERTGQQ